MNKLLFKDAYDQYLKYVDIKQKNQSKRSIENIFENHILKYYKNKNIFEFNYNDYIEFQSRILKNKYKYTYLKKIHYTFSGFLEYCVNFLDLDKNVCKIVGCFKKNINSKIEHKIYNHKEFKKFIKQIKYYPDKILFKFMYFYGTRPGETMALKFSHIENKIHIKENLEEHINKETGKRETTTPKSISSNRYINIDIILKYELKKLKNFYIKKYKNENYDYYVFGGIKPIAPTTLRRKIKKYSNLAKIKYIKPHEFRHSNASFLFNKKIPLEIISKRLGHANKSITLDNYIHNLEKEKRVNITLLLSRLF